MRIWAQKSASMQRRTNPLKFGDLAEKSELNSVSNLSTKVHVPCRCAKKHVHDQTSIHDDREDQEEAAEDS